jgi:hypothetical protein
MDMPSWEDVEALIRNDIAREFRIDIESDSTIKADQEAEKQARTEFLTAVSGFMQQAASVPPQLAPLAMELLLFGVRGFKVSRELETSFEAFIEKMRKEAEEPQTPMPNPDEVRAKAESEKAALQFEADKFKAQAEMQAIQARGLQDEKIGAINYQLKQLEYQIKLIELEGKKIDKTNNTVNDNILRL